MAEDADDLFETIESGDAAPHKVAIALAKLERTADRGDVAVAEGIAEVFAFSESHRDPAKAYFLHRTPTAALLCSKVEASSRAVGAGEA